MGPIFLSNAEASGDINLSTLTGWLPGEPALLGMQDPRTLANGELTGFSDAAI